MTISESLQSLNSYPIPADFIVRTGIGRGLDVEEDIDATITASDAYRLAEADIYMWLSEQPDLKEQSSSVDGTDDVRQRLENKANDIYHELGDAKFSGDTYGYNGDEWP